jgi:hypothetical protein
MAMVYPGQVRNTEGDRTENRALFTFLCDQTQGYKFFCQDMEVRSLFSSSLATEIRINDVRGRVGGSPMSCFPRAGQNFSFLADLS